MSEDTVKKCIEKLKALKRIERDVSSTFSGSWEKID